MIMPAGNHCTRDLPALVTAFFGPGSPLANDQVFGDRPYEPRPQQVVMAENVAWALEENENVCIEAPTGTGKSLAYLLPAILASTQSDKPVIVATNTIALQEQLLSRDIPLLQRVLDTPFKAALAKGRENYVCLRKLMAATRNQAEYLPVESLVPEVQRLARWAERSANGSRSDIPFLPSQQTWSIVCSEAGNCPNERGHGDSKCFYRQARRELFDADVIIVNHALFCVDLAMRQSNDFDRGLLPDYQAVIIDEAHAFEGVAATHLGARVSSAGIQYIFGRLLNRSGARGLLSKKRLTDARKALAVARMATDQFLAEVRNWMAAKGQAPIAYDPDNPIANVLTPGWSLLEQELSAIGTDDRYDKDYRLEVTNVLHRLKDIRLRLVMFLQRKEQDFVYWLETTGRQHQHITFNMAPIEIREILSKSLFQADIPVILTSATLAVKGKLDFVLRRLGADKARTVILDTPFNYREQVDLYVPFSEMPDPRDSQKFVNECAVQIQRFVIKSGGKAFVLFTNYTMMYQAETLLQRFFADNEIRLLVQGRELDRSRMLDAFRSDINSVIFGTDSFWMGVDVPGEALSNVIIVKLPFMVPSHPLTKARSDVLERQGRNPFFDYFLPEAVLKFRQGIGRLIRSRHDHGMLVVLDPRIIRTTYGKVFLESIPACRRHIF